MENRNGNITNMMRRTAGMYNSDHWSQNAAASWVSKVGEEEGAGES